MPIMVALHIALNLHSGENQQHSGENQQHEHGLQKKSEQHSGEK